MKKIFYIIIVIICICMLPLFLLGNNEVIITENTEGLYEKSSVKSYDEIDKQETTKLNPFTIEVNENKPQLRKPYRMYTEDELGDSIKTISKTKYKKQRKNLIYSDRFNKAQKNNLEKTEFSKNRNYNRLKNLLKDYSKITPVKINDKNMSRTEAAKLRLEKKLCYIDQNVDYMKKLDNDIKRFNYSLNTILNELK